MQHYRISDGSNQDDCKPSCMRTIKGHKMPITCMSFDTSGSMYATGSSDKSVRVWDVSKGYCTHSFREHSGVVTGVHFPPPLSEDRLLLVSRSEDCTCRTFDLITSSCVSTAQQHMSSPTDIAFSPDGRIMASCGRDKVLLFRSYTCHINIHTHHR